MTALDIYHDKKQKDWDIKFGERFSILKDFRRFGLEHWGSDVSTMTVQEAIGRLMAFEAKERGRRQSRGDNSEQLMLMTRVLESPLKRK